MLIINSVCISKEFCEAVKPFLKNPAHLKTIMAAMTAILTSSSLPRKVRILDCH